MIALPGLPALPRLSFWQWASASLLAAALALLVWVYGLRVDLPIIGEIGPRGLIAERDEALATVAAMTAQRNAARAERDRIAAANEAATEKANTDVERNLRQERDRADAFIAAGGVRRCPTARDNASASGQVAGVDAGAGALPELDGLRRDDTELVTVLPEDVRICTENTVKAREWREWGLTIEANNKSAQ